MDDTLWAEMTSEHGPLGTFDQKILVGYAFNLFDDYTYENLNIIRRIRNALAHAKRVVTFDHELVKAELRQVRLPPKSKKNRYIELWNARNLTNGGRAAFVRLFREVQFELMNKEIEFHRGSVKTLKRQVEELRQMRKSFPRLLARFRKLGIGLPPPQSLDHQSDDPKSAAPKGSRPKSPS